MTIVWTLAGLLTQAAQSIGGGAKLPSSPYSMMAGSPFTDYDASVALYVLMVGVLVAVLLIGAFMVLNLGMLSKRDEDRVGGRDPSDLQILEHTVWPDVPRHDKSILPAEADVSFIKKLVGAELSSATRSNEEMGETKAPGRAA